MGDLQIPQKKNFKGWCYFMIFIMFVLFIVAFFEYVDRLDDSVNPSAYIQDLYVPSLVVVPALNKTTTTFNTSVFVDLKFERAAALKRYSYGDIQMALLYDQHWSKTVGTHVIEGFSMGGKKRVHVKAAVVAIGMPWEEAARAVSGGDVVPMVVELKVDPDPYAIPWVAHVAVDASGHMVSKKPVEFEKPCSWCRRRYN